MSNLKIVTLNQAKLMHAYEDTKRELMRVNWCQQLL